MYEAFEELHESFEAIIYQSIIGKNKDKVLRWNSMQTRHSNPHQNVNRQKLIIPKLKRHIYNPHQNVQWGLARDISS